ncbi:hypothetical protein HPG69_005716, partial [Diceros bicornis minor]
MWSNISAVPFLLTGFPGLEIFHPWISVSFFVIYVSILLSNGTLLFLIREDHTLREPMYYFLAILAATDLGVTWTTMPTVLGVLWLNHREISHGACYFQAYLIHSFSIVEGFIFIVPIIITLSQFPYCKSHVLSYAFCLHQDVIKLACADITFNRLYPIALVSLTGFLDSVLILISYILILKTIKGIASGKEKAKALNTCVSHISCVLVFYVTVTGLTLTHQFGKYVSHVVHIIMSCIYFLFPPFVNPIIYSIKTKQIQNGLEAVHHWISIPSFAVYISWLLDDGTLLYLIKNDHSLHEPMYYFLAMLASTDLTVSTMPTVMGVLRLNHCEMSHRACFLQTHFILSCSIVESGILVAMTYGSFFAIHNPPAAPFLLTGFPGLEAVHHWISIPFFAVYISVLLGNGILLYLIKNDHNLHEPMYYFLAMLAGTDLMVTLTNMPSVMGVLWLNQWEMSHGACLLQAYFIHSLSIVESGILLAMAYDRFIAICTPLRYNSILTNYWVMKVGLGVLMRGFLSLLPPILPLYWFPYCRSHVLSHAFCIHQDVMKLACADITFNRIYPVFLTVVGIASGEQRARAFNTCVSHINCVLVFYITVISLTFIH